ncbi:MULTISPECIES: NAD(P)/FAD-dependent oxidoreductase [Bradyrhizobium]|uniref:NAD(P)/FAD-dependent oxidoreductase n=1 Tax=Bradyrhizobium centrosematis TaxID=1300039 RepID=UPI00216A2C8C|nr:FAD-dependent oxidoreductase [Bradyrhizobium centrosematis]MCS3765639.1 NADPH-dependent 2,4-dienoyl-CoA reductase/sulfur reductase-like enzyme [Bradyrhizobium centrosematis]MCS3778173.1 NADPH-dependent 2,4-dienoyl-CoA reductase/sulfur reductase-like enzyme [Bradyrhizobium centrosematis]
MNRFVVIGAGPTGHHAALELRRIDSGAHITLISEEHEPPYDRPPLSKNALSHSAFHEEKLRLLRSGIYADLAIELLTGTRITALDRSAGIAIAQSGKSYCYDRLLIATGSSPRRLDFYAARTTGEYLRTVDDARHLRKVIFGRGRLAIIGGGFIGLEIAAAAQSRGCDVTVLEASPRVLTRGMPTFVSDWALQAHRQKGVNVRLGVSITEVKRLPDQRYAIVVDGEILLADAVAIGVGIIPNTGLAVESGLNVDNGVVVNRFCVTSDPRIYAAGEVSSHPYGPDGRLRRIESWQTSIDHGLTAARNMAEVPTSFVNVPWFWSDQYDYNVQSIGFPDEAVQYRFSEHSTANAWTLIGLGERSEIIGAVSVNRGRDISILKRAMQTTGRLPESLRLSQNDAFCV